MYFLYVLKKKHASYFIIFSKIKKDRNGVGVELDFAYSHKPEIVHETLIQFLELRPIRKTSKSSTGVENTILHLYSYTAKIVFYFLYVTLSQCRCSQVTELVR